MKIVDSNLTCYIKEVERFPLLTKHEEETLCEEYHRSRDASTAYVLVVANLRFVVKIAHEYKGYGLSILDLIQEGNVGLMKAVAKFDPAKGVRLVTYAAWWIRAQMQRHIVRTWSLVRTGKTGAQLKLFYNLRSCGAVSVEEIAKQLEVTEEDVAAMQVTMSCRDVSLNAGVSRGDRFDDPSAYETRLDRLVDPHPNPEEALAAKEQSAFDHERLQVAMKYLNARQRLVIEYRFCREDSETLEAIREMLGVSRERVRQLEVASINKLRKRI